MSEAGEQITTVASVTASDRVNPEGPQEVVLDEGYRSNEVLVQLAECEVRSCCSEPDLRQQHWEGKAEAQGVRQPATNSGRARQALIAAAGREAGTELCPPV